jgi:uracil-DNA glycosylase
MERSDLVGHPFVGPAGRLLDSSLEEAGIERSLAYVTNVVKHFKWEPCGKRLRAPDADTRRAEKSRFIEDLRLAKSALELQTRKAR